MSEPMLPNRRDFVLLAAGAFVVTTVPFVSRKRDRLVRRTVPAMGSTAEIAVVHRDERYAHAAAAAALGEIRRIEVLMTRFDGASDIGRANISAWTTPVSISRETAFVIETGLEWAQLTDGAFDPAVARIVDLWDVAHRHEPPAAVQVQRLANRQLYKHVDVGPHAGGRVVRFTEGDVALDLGGIAAGYAVDRAVRVLREWGIRDGFINVSGDIYALGRSGDGDAWKVGVRSPTDPDAIIATVDLGDSAIATSGDYEQFFMHQGRRYHHILDPRTAAPRQTAMRTITVQADDCLTADAATTALFGMDRETAVALLTRRPGKIEVI